MTTWINHTGKSDRLAKYGPIVPMTYKAPRVFRLYRKMQAEEARLARAVGEKPQPAAWKGIAIISAITIAASAVWIVTGPDPVKEVAHEQQ
ncbi:hypothetical protein [Novosphingobium sp. HII-3]|uniref:hypothetical protein n=1 Tax=Novosphingobium sp. HII-3 TaxID=2075565 RepID=UPI000CDB76B6|nr:hypothetical protein [Novosphingobium sp. HII-3]